jgi:hypothetical protein
MSSQNNNDLGGLIQAGVTIVTEELDEPVLNGHPRGHADELEAFKRETILLRTRSIIWGALIVLFATALAFVFAFEGKLADWSWSGTLPRDPAAAADNILAISPVIVRVTRFVFGERDVADRNGIRIGDIGWAHWYALLRLNVGFVTSS